MSKRFLHFTDYKGAESILDSGVLLQASYGPEAVFAVIEGGAWVPAVQISSLGRAPKRVVAVVFKTSFLPDYIVPEEAMWHIGKIPIDVIDIITVDEAKKMLNDSISTDNEFGLCKTPHHPAFNDWGDWTRMPENFKPWLPGRDNEKYKLAQKVWISTKDIEIVKQVWDNPEKAKKILTTIEEAVTTLTARCLRLD